MAPPAASPRRRRRLASSPLSFSLVLLLLLAVVAASLLSATPASAAAASSSFATACSAGDSNKAGGARRRLASTAAAGDGKSSPLAPAAGRPAPNPLHHRRSRRLRRARALLQGPADSKSAPSGAAGYTLLGTAPVAVAHTHLIPGTRDKILAMNYFDASGSYPDNADADGRTIARVLDRAAFSFENVAVGANAVCGAWTGLPDGKIGMFAGHVPAGVQPAGFDNLFAYDPVDGEHGGIEDRGALSQGRWYPGVCALPNGRALVYGGSADVDFNGRSPDGDVFSHATNDVERTPAMPAFFGDLAYGPYYPLLVALPGPENNNSNNNNNNQNNQNAAVLMALHSRAGVVVPETGELLAEAPPFPEPYQGLVFEYPMSGSLAMLRADPRLSTFGAPGGAGEARVEIVVTGGVLDPDFYREYKLCDDRENYLRTCSDGVLTIGLTMTAAGGGDGNVAYAFDDAWRVTAMGPEGGRCVHDAVVLPNNKVLIINGVNKGYAGLGDCQLAHDPHNQAWVFDPATIEAAPTGHTTPVPRLYHGSAALTARGDVLVTGTTNTKGWTNTRELPLDPSPWASEYRVEIYTPSEIGGAAKRPAISRAPTTALFGGSFTIETDEAISAVVLMFPGGATHGMPLNQRAQDLSFEEEQGGGGIFNIRKIYRVQAPASPQNAPPGHYLLFVVAADGAGYSEGSWLMLRASMDEPLQTLPQGSVKVTQASTGFEEEDEDDFQCGAPCVLRNGRDSAGTGGQGARLAANAGGAWSDVLLASGDVDSGALADAAAGESSDGSYAYVLFYARGGGDLTVAWADVAAVAAGATETDQAVVPGTRTTVHLTGDGEWRLYALKPVFLPRAAGQVRLVIGGTETDVDDVETWASGASTVVNAAFRAALRLRTGGAAAATMGGKGGGGAMAAGGHAHRNERFLSPKARAFGVYA